MVGDGSCKLWVGNLKFETTWKELEPFFAQFGEILHGEVASSYKRTGSKGWGTVLFATAEQAAAAAKRLHDFELHGRAMIVRTYKDSLIRIEQAPSATPTFKLTETQVGRRLFVTNLSYKTDWRDLRNHFLQIGPVVFSRIIHDIRKGISLGLGLVEMETAEGTARALARLHDSWLAGRHIRVRQDRADRHVLNYSLHFNRPCPTRMLQVLNSCQGAPTPSPERSLAQLQAWQSQAVEGPPSYLGQRVLEEFTGYVEAAIELECGEITPFDACRAPQVAVLIYLRRLQHRFNCSPACFVLARIYLRRVLSNDSSRISLCSTNVHRLLLTAVVTAVKFHDDSHASNSVFARGGGVCLQEMNLLELLFLKLLGWRLFVDNITFEREASLSHRLHGHLEMFCHAGA